MKRENLGRAQQLNNELTSLEKTLQDLKWVNSFEGEMKATFFINSMDVTVRACDSACRASLVMIENELIKKIAEMEAELRDL